MRGVLRAGLKILVGWALEYRHFWGFNQASKLAFSGWSQIKIALVLILLRAEYEIHNNLLNHQWKGCRRTTHWTLPEAGSVKLNVDAEDARSFSVIAVVVRDWREELVFA